jgi:GntR family transcriptional repressor for pyruvate dehydrogenase complex
MDPQPADKSLFQPRRERRAFDTLMLEIKHLITSGRLKPGDRLPSERALAEQFAVSRNTVREAFRMLEISGAIELKRGTKGGAFVLGQEPDRLAAEVSQALSLTDFSLEDLTDSMRWVCGMTLRAAGPRLTKTDIKALREHLVHAETISADSDRALFLIDFYGLLARATGNPVLEVLVDNLLSILKAVVPLLKTAGHGHVIESRRQLVDLLEAGQIDAAASALDAYLVDLHRLWLDGPEPQMPKLRSVQPPDVNS